MHASVLLAARWIQLTTVELKTLREMQFDTEHMHNSVLHICVKPEVKCFVAGDYMTMSQLTIKLNR